MYDARIDKAIIELISHLKRKIESPIRILEIGCGTGVRSDYLSKAFPHWDVIATDYCRERPKDLSSSVGYIHQDVHDISFRDNYFDAVFSVAVSEHYSNTERALQEQHRVLKPGGLFYFVHTPFFSSSKGHHAHYSNDHCSIFPPYGHLYLNEDEFLERTLDRAHNFGLNSKIPQNEIKRIVNRIYNRPDLSRIWHKEFTAIFNRMPFEVRQWLEIDDPFFEKDQAASVLPHLRASATASDLRVEKVRCAALKIPVV